MSTYVKTTDFASKDGLASGAALKALKGTELGLEFDNIATMSATKVDSASNASLLSLVLTGSTVPSNGIYLPSANTLGLSSNSVLRGSVNSTGNWVFVAPTSGTGVTLSAAAAQYGLIINANAGGGAKIVGSASSAGTLDLVDGNAGNQLWSIASGSPAIGSFGISTTAGAIAFAITSAKVVQAVDDTGTLQTVGWRDLPTNIQNVNYTTVLADRGKQIQHNNASPHTYTIDSNANVAYPLGTVLTFINVPGGGALTIAITADTMTLANTASTGSRTLGGAGIATAVKMAATSWLISGVGLT